MKIILYLCLLLYTTSTVAQVQSLKYRRSSLFTLMLTNEKRKYEDVISKTFLGYPIPEKFNNHNLGFRVIKTSNLPDSLKLNVINAYLDSNDVARKLVAHWFNRNEKGYFNMNLIAERGSYNASEMDAAIAKKTKRGLTLLEDAGEELIGNTFILISDFRFINKEELRKVIKERVEQTEKNATQIEKVANRIPFVKKTPAGASLLHELNDLTAQPLDVLSKGYVVVTTSYLYRLVWNDSVATVFYKDLWMKDNAFDKNRKYAFEHTSLFQLQYVGSEVAWADLQSTIYSTKSEEQLVQIATIRSLDAVIVKLQKEHEAFRTSTPLISTDPPTAGIGLKEGLESSDHYEVLQQVINEDGKTSYETIGVIKPLKDQIWDNRYMATGDSLRSATTFEKGKGKQFYPGMLIRQKGKSGLQNLLK
ncbi:hypothetical protein F0919_10970 [Taibaiella lutea]|uniref:Uncharacterized protein n=1 Tax=Taibaiella lutea TaxID=2608001 RepID=A0A5M6CPE3_9BACT|nr:hypothetical protein [Taibaiella lutea]KAA5535105.1 hypothetical protein F0919_10970 [Taibaiella lutea]